jgi:hypothetical protein
VTGREHGQEAEHPVLPRLRHVARVLGNAQEAYDQLLLQAIEAGLSEREIGRAAGISGPAVNQRKRALPPDHPASPRRSRAKTAGRREEVPGG